MKKAAAILILGLALLAAPCVEGEEPARPGRGPLEDELLQKLIGD